MAKQSLATVESNPGAGLPVAFLVDPEMSIQESAPLYESTPYITFVSSRGAGFARLAAQLPDLEEGNPVLVLPLPEKPVLLDPFRYYLIASRNHYSEVDNLGGIVRSTFNRDVAKADPHKKWGDPKRLTEHVEAVVLVVLPDRLVPATATFKTAKVSGVTPATEAFATASTPDWGAISAEHKASLVVPDARFRFITTVRMRGNVSRSSGNTYVSAQGVVKPTGAADWKLLGDWLKDKGNHELAEAVKSRYQRRLEEVASKGM